MEEWYYTMEGQQQGPVNLGTLRDMAEDGRLRPQDMVWNSSMSDWTPASEVDGIFSRAIAGVGSEAQTPDNMESDANWANDTHLHEIEPGSEPLEIGRVISRTLELTKKNFLNLFLLGLVVFGISMAMSMVMQLVTVGAGFSTSELSDQTFQTPGEFEEFSTPSSVSAGASIFVILVIIALQLVSMAVNLYLSLGMTRACLNIVDGRQARISQLFGEPDKILRALGASIIAAIMICIGLILLIIPGIFLMIRLAAIIPAIVERNMGVFDAINYSFKLTKGNGFNILLLWLVGIILMLFTIVITCGLGAIIAGPVFTLGWVLCYRWMQYGRRVAAD